MAGQEQRRRTVTPLAEGLLYIDQRQSGFSYDLDTGGAAPPSTAPSANGAADHPACAFSRDEDAAEYVRVILRFLAAHPAIQKNPVILLGESYSGVRVSAMLNILLHYTESDASASGTGIQAEIQKHFDLVFPSMAGAVIPVTRITQQFGRQILVEPLVWGSPQWETQDSLMHSDPTLAPLLRDDALDRYDLQKPKGWSDDLDTRAENSLGELGRAKLLGIDLPAIAGLFATQRTGAYRLSDSSGAALPINRALATLLGATAPGDYYFTPFAICPSDTYDAGYGDFTIGNIALSNFTAVRSFITNARYDSVIYAPAIPKTLSRAGITATIDTAPRPNVERPGWFRFSVPAKLGAPASNIEVRFPSYVSSGHMVSVSQGADLAHDIEEWLAER